MDIAERLPACAARERLAALEELYARADEAVRRFQDAAGLSCPFGCGSCCEGFVPDILPAEAEYLAAYLAVAEPERAYALAASGLEAAAYPGGRLGCPLYRPDTPYHCSVYEARPLICRLFAFSAVRDKRGEPSYSLCRLMPDATVAPGLRRAAGEGLRAFGSVPAPVMADFGSEAAALCPAGGERGPLPERLEAALSKILFLIGLSDNADPENDGPDLSPPLPNAS